MSMIGYLIRVSNKELDAYLNDSTLLEERVWGDLEDEEVEDDGREIDIDKTWEGLLYILAGATVENIEQAATPLRWAIFGDYVIDEDQDLGYGPANYCTAEQAKEVAAALNVISTADFKTMFTNASAKMDKEMYPTRLWPGNDEFDYFRENFELLKQFYTAAAANGDAVITYIA